MASSVALRAAKKELRSLMKQKLTSISHESIQKQSKTLFDSLTRLRPYVEAKRIGIYLAMPTGEIQTDSIVRDALGSGKQVFVPYLYKSEDRSPDTPKSVMDMVDIRSIADYDTLKRDSWGIPTIGADTVSKRERILTHSNTESGELDLILMPGVAFDIDPETAAVRRLGHGKGFYDYFLYRYGRRMDGTPSSPGKDVLLYGLALEEQLLDSKAGAVVPVGQHDHFLDGLLVGNGNVLETKISNRTR
ncbi:5-formyltetrahydrofolate cyclo-ligase, partial [Scytalidium lignicola]